MRFLSQATIAFLAGAFYEGLCVLWVDASERRLPARAAVISAAVALVQLLGLEGSLKDWRIGLAYALGYAAGTWLAVRCKPVSS